MPSFREFYRRAKERDPKIKLHEAREFYVSKIENQIHTVNKQRNHYLPITTKQDSSYQIDLAFLPKLKSKNQGFQVILTAIEITSRYAYAYKSKDKSSNSITDLIHKFIEEAEPRVITSDNGSEFISKGAQKLFKLFKISHNLAEPEDHHKLGMIERFNRTLKDRLAYRMTQRGHPIWYDILDEEVRDYNESYHRGVKAKPVDMVGKKLDKHRRDNALRTKILLESRQSFAIGDKVRLKNKKDLFEKGASRYSEEVYSISDISLNNSSYRLRNAEGNLLKRVAKYEDLLLTKDEPNLRQKLTKTLQKTVKEHRIERNLKKAGVSKKDIVKNIKRKRKAVEKLNL